MIRINALDSNVYCPYGMRENQTVVVLRPKENADYNKTFSENQIINLRSSFCGDYEKTENICKCPYLISNERKNKYIFIKCKKQQLEMIKEIIK